MGSFRYINDLASRDNLTKFLEMVDLAAGAGKDVNNVFDLSDRFNQSRPMNRCLTALRSHPASARMLEERYVGPAWDLGPMSRMPKYSLGWTYAQVMTMMGYDPQFYRHPERFADDAAYVNFRVYKTHDIHHVLTGFSLDDLGELGVISVTSPSSAIPPSSSSACWECSSNSSPASSSIAKTWPQARSARLWAIDTAF